MYTSGYRKIPCFDLYRNLRYGVGIFYIVVLLASCVDQSTDESPLSTPALDSLKEQAITISQKGDHHGAMRFYDSVFRKHEDPTVLDRYCYYYFMADINKYVNRGKEHIYLDSAITLLESTGTQNKLSRAYAEAVLTKADLQMEEGNTNEAYENYYRAKNIAEGEGDSCSLGNYNYRLAMALYRSERYHDAIDNFRIAFNHSYPCKKDITFFYRGQEILDNIGLCYQKLAMYDSALGYYNKALVFINEGYETLPSDRLWMLEVAKAVVYGNIGSTYLQKGNYKPAESYFLKNIEINTGQWYNVRDAQFTRIKLADLYFRQGRNADAEKILYTVGQVNDTAADTEVELRWNDLLWQYHQHNDPAKAVRYLNRYITLKDSLAAARKHNIYLDIDEQVNSLNRAGRIQQLQEKNKLRAFYLAVVIFIAFLFAIIALLIRYNARRSKKYVRMLQIINQRIGEQKTRMEQVLKMLERSDKEKDRILKAVAHDMRSPMNSALGLIDVLDNMDIPQEHREYILEDHCKT